MVVYRFAFVVEIVSVVRMVVKLLGARFLWNRPWGCLLVRVELIRPLFSYRARFEVESHMRLVGREYLRTCVARSHVPLNSVVLGSL